MCPFCSAFFSASSATSSAPSVARMRSFSCFKLSISAVISVQIDEALVRISSRSFTAVSYDSFNSAISFAMRRISPLRLACARSSASARSVASFSPLCDSFNATTSCCVVAAPAPAPALSGPTLLFLFAFLRFSIAVDAPATAADALVFAAFSAPFNRSAILFVAATTVDESIDSFRFASSSSSSSSAVCRTRQVGVRFKASLLPPLKARASRSQSQSAPVYSSGRVSPLSVCLPTRRPWSVWSTRVRFGCKNELFSILKTKTKNNEIFKSIHSNRPGDGDAWTA